MEIKVGKIDHNFHPLRRKGDKILEICDHTDRPSEDGIGRTLAYETIFSMTFKEIAAVATGLLAVGIPLVTTIIK